MKLTQNKISKLPLFKSVCDGNGLYIRLHSPGSGAWTFKYMRTGVKRELGLGSYPDVSLAIARQKRDILKGQLALGQDPFCIKQQAKQNNIDPQKYRFSHVAELVINSKKQTRDICLVTVSKSHKSDKDNNFIDFCKKEFKKVEELPTGSSLKLCRVAEGKANIYSRMGPTYQWDIAAGQAVVEAAGGTVSNLEGKPLRYEFISEKKNPLFYCSGDPLFPWKNIFDKLV